MNNQEPIAEIRLAGKRLTLLGTAHVSQVSAEKVDELLSSDSYDAVAVELCPSRTRAMLHPNDLARLNLFQVIREGKAVMVLGNLAMTAYQQRLADELGIEPGAEMRTAIRTATDKRLPVWLIDRDIGITLKRLYRNIPWYQRLALLGGLGLSVVSKEKISAEEVERLKDGDILEATLYQIAEQHQFLYKPLIEERDRYMAARLRHKIQFSDCSNVLVVVGAGHLKGLQKELEKPIPPPEEDTAALAQLEKVPLGSLCLKCLPWLIVTLIIAGFGFGFSRSPDLGWHMIEDWIYINGGLSALGALLAGGHLVTILTAFAAAPLTSLNPMIGAGLVTAAVEILVRKPTVGDFSRLRSDAASLKGWWQNRVARALLVFVFSNIGSALGTYIAGFSIFERLAAA